MYSSRSAKIKKKKKMVGKHCVKVFSWFVATFLGLLSASGQIFVKIFHLEAVKTWKTIKTWETDKARKTG